MQMDIKNPGEIAKMQSPGDGGLMNFFGAVVPHYRRSAPVSRVWGRHSPTSSRPRGQMSEGRNLGHGSNLALPCLALYNVVSP